MRPLATDTSPSSAPINPAVARQAANWMVRMSDPACSPADIAACQRWRARDAENERAWQRAQQVRQAFANLPADLSMPTLQRRAALQHRRNTVRRLALLIAAGPAAWLTWQTTSQWREWTADERTAAGERRDLTLPDGSQLTINTASALNVNYDSTQRLLRLISGEILLRTAAAPDSRPLLVDTPQGRIHALGTRFAVRTDTGDGDKQDMCLVSVLEGAVEVSPGHAPQQTARINARQQALFTGEAVRPAAPLTLQSTAWITGQLHADGMRLGDFAAELSRYRKGFVRCDPAVADLRLTGTYQLGDTDAVLTLVEQTLPVQVTYRTRYLVSIAPRQA